MAKSNIEVIGHKEETHIFPISIGSHEYEGRTCWSVYKGSTYMNAIADAPVRTREDALKVAASLMSGTNTKVTHGLPQN